MVQKVTPRIKNIRFDFRKYDLIRSLHIHLLLSCCCLELHVSSPGLSPEDEFLPSGNTTEDFSMQGNVENQRNEDRVSNEVCHCGKGYCGAREAKVKL